MDALYKEEVKNLTFLKAELKNLTLKIRGRDSRKGLDVFGCGNLEKVLNAPYCKYDYESSKDGHYLYLNPFFNKTEDSTPAKKPPSMVNQNGWINHIRENISIKIRRDGFVGNKYDVNAFAIAEEKTAYGIVRTLRVDLDKPIEQIDKKVNSDETTSQLDENKTADNNDLLLQKIDEMNAKIDEMNNIIQRWFNVEQTYSE